jgi:predicted nucleic acid-binding protein
MNERAFIDSSVLVDGFQDSHLDHHTRANVLLDRVAQGRMELYLSSTVLLETAYVLTKTYAVPRQLVANGFRSLLNLPTIVTPETDVLHRTVDLWERESPLSFADCYHLVLAESLGLDTIYSFDKKMDRYPGVNRLEP